MNTHPKLSPTPGGSRGDPGAGTWPWVPPARPLPHPRYWLFQYEGVQFRPAYKKDRTLTLVQNFLRELGSLYKTFLGKNFLSNSYLVFFFDFDPP